jgi:hypothetical protein
MRDHILTAGRALVTFLDKERAQGDQVRTDPAPRRSRAAT